MADMETRINELVATFVAEITRLARTAALDTLNRALGTDGGSPAPAPAPIAAAPAARPARAPRPASAASASAKRAKGEKRPKAEIAQMQDQVLAHIKANPGQRIEHINKVLGTKTSDLTLPLKKLIAAGAVTTKGARRATTYFPGSGDGTAAAGKASGGKKRKRGK
ncbi:MAG: DNA-binding protein [Kofleriaceae bacterium]|jgi:hypothetical protein|nr:DNA-binding protein [Kofleriaceae bacterium]MBP9170801.1 DNA-binding protein [Kofleriaceae bacterium]MBP9857684.1 DNA-binding protein [Kofleriaceae bacterium]